MFSVSYYHRKKINSYYSYEEVYLVQNKRRKSRLKKLYKKLASKMNRNYSDRIIREDITPYDYELSKLTVDNLWELYDYSI